MKVCNRLQANLVCKTHVFHEQEPLAEILQFMTSKSMKNSETWNEEGQYKSKMQLHNISLIIFICFISLKFALE